MRNQMIVKEEFLAKLRRFFSLNLYEVKIWTALLSRGIATAGELSDIADVPRSRSYDVLESLEKKGFAVAKLGKPIKYIAIQPAEVVERVKKHMKEEAEAKIKRLEELRNTDVLSELNQLHLQGIELVEPAELSGALRGRHNIYNHIESKFKAAERSITIATTTQGFIQNIEGFKPLFEKLKKKGVKIRIAAPITKECDSALKEIAHIAEVRHSDQKARFVIVDSKETVFMLLDDSDVHPTYDVGIWINTPYFSSVLENLFDSAWRGMKPVR